MTAPHDFKKEWEMAKKQILKFSKEAAKLTKKGEIEIIKFSKISKLHLDSTAMGIKKEKLYYLIGKEYVASKDPAKSVKLKKMVSEIQSLERGQKSIKTKLTGKTKAAPKTRKAKKTANKKVKK